MRVGIEYTAALNQRAGIGRFVRNLVSSLLATDPQVHWVLLHAALNGADPAVLPHAPNVTTAEVRLPERWLTILWHRLRVPLPVESFTGPLDIFHAPDFVLPPVQHARRIVTVHDLAFLLYPECADARLRSYLMAVVPRSIQRADFVVADSANTQNDVICLLGADPARTAVVPGGVEARFQPAAPEVAADLRERLGLHAPFILSIGMIEPRKNWQGLIRAYSQARARHRLPHQLVLAGPRGWLWENIFEERERSPFRNDIIFLGYVADADLPALYSAADVFAFPSLYEGFGLPPLEAMACGTPVVVSDAASLPEVVGDAGLTVPAEDTDALAAALARLLLDDALRAQLAAAGRARAAQFTWGAAAVRQLEVYRHVLTL
ncbi:MAG: glycosyltransferase family 4 protein [Chloroflexi bacterium]|nr:glycosyltransferase family 4 protein [Chloroflexota bacterium]